MIFSIQAPQYRQHVLISNFLDLVRLGIRDEATMASNWIKHRRDGLKIQNLALATMTGTAMSSLPKNKTADIQHAINKCESLGSGKQLVSRESIGDGKPFFTAYGSPSTSYFIEYAI